MPKPKGLVIVHVDGLGYKYLQEGLEQGHLPFVQSLIDTEGYQVLRYRCGLPSTTPFVQAGILYGDNSEIPSFRWWDKQSGLGVSFSSARSTFGHVAHKYFRDCESLVTGGAAIATCYPDSAKANFRLGYRRRLRGTRTFSLRRVFRNWLLNPIHLVDWAQRGIWELGKANVQYWSTVLRGRPAAEKYVLWDMLEEIMVHHLTRFAVFEAMKENFPVIYAAFYAYDEIAHAFGPQADYSLRILRQVDYTIRRIAEKRTRPDPESRAYELIVVSDHGQVDTVPFDQRYHQSFGDLVAEWLPNFEIEQSPGKNITRDRAIDGHIVIDYSGGLAHFYFKDISQRLHHHEIQERFPGLIDRVAATPGIAFVLTRDGPGNILTTKDQRIKFGPPSRLSLEACDVLGRYDTPEILACQLQKLNSFERSGDLVCFGEYVDHHQVNFEIQVGGHGSLGGEQLFPFILAKREWNFDTSGIIDASGLYPLLRGLRDQLVK